MYMKLYRKVNKKKSGYVLLESVVILMIVACICIILNKIAINNYLKSVVIHTRDDIKTLTVVEERILLESINYFNTNKSNTEYSNDALNINIEIYGDKGVMKKKSGLNEKSHVELKCIRSGGNEGEILNIVPNLYKTENITPR